MEERTPPPSEGPLAVKDTLVVNENTDAGDEKENELHEAAAEAVRSVIETVMDNVVEQICSACKDPNGSLQFEKEDQLFREAPDSPHVPIDTFVKHASKEAPDSILGEVPIDTFVKHASKDDESSHGPKHKNIFKKLLNWFNSRPRRADVDVDEKTVEVENADYSPLPEIKSIPREAPDSILGDVDIDLFKNDIKETKKVKKGIRRVIRRFFCCTLSSRKSQN